MGSFLKGTTYRRDGFTIVELLIVIVVIAVLAAIVTVAYGGVREKAVQTAIATDLANNAKSLEVKKTISGSGTYKDSIPEFLSVPGSQSTVKFKYGTPTSFCLEARRTNQADTVYHVRSDVGMTSPQEGACPTPSSNALTMCTAGKVSVVVQQTNDTSGDVIITNTTIYGDNTSTVRVPGQSYSVFTPSGLTSIPAGYTTSYVTGANGFSYSNEHYHAYDARSCS